jgi:hypothetical protein
MGEETVRVGVLGLENLNRDPRYDYLEGMIFGVILYDFTRADGVELVERARIDRIITEQELRLTGLLADEDTARQVGQLAGADALLEGSYVFLGREVLINLSLMTVDNGKVTAISARGHTENTVHEVAEQAIEALTGTPIILAGPEGERSLLSLSDEEPGSIEFYCNFIEGEVFVNEEFYGYTPGGTTPMLLEDLSPGPHIIRVEAGPNFGEVDFPKVIFKDWERTVEVKAGRKIVVRARVRHFNNIIYGAKDLFRNDWDIEPGVLEEVVENHDLSFTDRDGRSVVVTLKIDARLVQEVPRFAVSLEYDGESRSWEIPGDQTDYQMEETIGLVEVEISNAYRYDRYWELDVDVSRNDLHQGMQHDEGYGWKGYENGPPR